MTPLTRLARRPGRARLARPGGLARISALALLHGAALSVLACVSPPCAPADLPAQSAAPRYGVVSSDYASSAIALLDADGRLLEEAWMDSGTVAPRIVAALSGDVVLPTTGTAPCRVAILDRFGTDAIAFADVCAGEVTSQLDVGAELRANPQDVVELGSIALVTRHQPNLAAGPSSMMRGNDVLVIELGPDPAPGSDGAPSVRGRVDLSVLDGELDGVPVFARPGRMAVLRRDADGHAVRRVVVGLARASLDFRVMDAGAVAVLDASESATTPSLMARLDLAPLRGCVDVEPLPMDPTRALVTCGGPAFDDADGRRGSAGLALLALGADGAVAIEAVWRSAEHPAAPVLDAFGVAIDSRRAVAVSMGDALAPRPDRLVLADLRTGETRVLAAADAAFVFGDGAYDPSADLLLVPDASRGVIRRFRLEGEPRALAPTPTAGCRGLPPREVRPLVRL